MHATGARHTGHDPREVLSLYETIRKGKAKLVGPNGDMKHLPKSLHSFLGEIISLLNTDHGAFIVQNQANLTTAEAAAMLGTSRQFFVNLLKKGEVPYHMVGAHRRIYAQDVVRYKAKRDSSRRKILADLVTAEVDEGLYDRIPPVNDD